VPPVTSRGKALMVDLGLNHPEADSTFCENTLFLTGLGDFVSPEPNDLLLTIRAVQPVATCRQLPYLHKPAIVIVTSFSL